MYKKDFKQKYFLYCRDCLFKIRREKEIEKQERIKRITIKEL